jgi:flagellar motility protein MotE (MotC chaperone)
MSSESQQILNLEQVAQELGGHCEITKSENQIKCEQLADEIYRLQSWHRARMESDGSKRIALEKTIAELNEILRKFS